MNPVSKIYQNPIIPPGNYWTKLVDVIYLPSMPNDVSDSWVVLLDIQEPTTEEHGIRLAVVIYGTPSARFIRHSFRDHFRCFDYPPHLAIGRWAKVETVLADYEGTSYSQVVFPNLSVPELNRVVSEAVKFEAASGCHSPFHARFV